jgi:hypothetical protein
MERTEKRAPLTTWDDNTRRTTWFIMTKTRKSLSIEIIPIVATSFIVLQSYFRSTHDNQYRLLTLICASLTLSCKLAETNRTISHIFSAILSAIFGIPSQAIRDFLIGASYTPDNNPTVEETDLIKNAEVMLMHSLEFNFDIELPFVYVDRWESCFNRVVPIEYKMKFVEQVKVYCCLVICSESCLDVPAEVCAAAAITEELKSKSSSSIPELEDYVKAKYGNKCYELAVNSLRFEMSRTARPPSKA